MRAKPNDMTPVVDLTREKGTGPSRTRRPIYVDLLAPCNNACPAGEHFEAWLRRGASWKVSRRLGDPEFWQTVPQAPVPVG